MALNVFDKSQTALTAYQTYQLRLAMAISYCRYLTKFEVMNLTIGGAVYLVNQSIVFQLDQLP